ncbi:MAG TPA: type IV secretory system conjugative DNA transfer family protein, partial [Acidimicrobiales bacterium]
MSPANGAGATGIDDPAERAVLVGLAVAGVWTALVLATGHLSAFLFNGGWPSYPAAEVPGILWRAFTTPLDPGSAWDEVNTGTDPPGPLAWWFTFVLLAAAVAGIAFLVQRARQRRAVSEVAGIRTASQRDVKKMDIARKDPGQLVVGTAGGHEIALKDHHSLLVLGPMRSGKTSAVTIPAVLEWPGPVVATSTAGDLVDHTIGWRSRQGDVHVFDPARATRHHTSGWTPLTTCRTWAGATRTAWDLAMAGKAAVGAAAGVGEFWFSSAARSLAPYLFAAAESSRTMEDVAHWIDAEERDEVLAELRTLEPDAAVAHAATFRREAAARSSLFHVMQQIVGAYLDPSVAASARTHEIEVEELLDGDPHTLYIVSPHHDRARVRPLFAAVVRQMLGAVHDKVARTRRPLDSPLLLVLDDAAEIAPVEDLPTLAATSAAAGVQVVTVFQDLTQIEIRHGDDAAAVITKHRAKLLLPGAGGVDAVDLAERLGTDEGAGGRTGAISARPALSPDVVRQLPADEAVLLYDDRAPLRVKLRHWNKNRELRRRAGVAQDALTPGDGREREPTSPFPTAAAAPEPMIINPVPTPPPVDLAALDDEIPTDTYLVP